MFASSKTRKCSNYRLYHCTTRKRVPLLYDLEGPSNRIILSASEKLPVSEFRYFGKYIIQLYGYLYVHVLVNDRVVWRDKTVLRTLELWCTWCTCFLCFSQFLKTYAAISNAHLFRVCKRGKLSGSCLSTLNGFGSTQLPIFLCHIRVPTFSSQNN